jgi:hypothetical protein
MRAISTPRMMKDFEPQAGRYETDLNNAIPNDWARTRYAEAIIRRKHARFLTVHLAALDHLEHESGPRSHHAIDLFKSTTPGVKNCAASPWDSAGLALAVLKNPADQ